MHTRRYSAVFAIVVAGTVLSGISLLAQKDPILGSWKLDVAKSTFPAAAPARRTMTFATVPNGIKQSIATTTSGNAEVTYNLVYTAKFDGKDYPADVASSFNTIEMKRIDARTIERIGKEHGKVVETETYTVSPDGKTLSVKQEGDNNGVPFKTAQVFERDAAK
jgi:hypothetical protein